MPVTCGRLKEEDAQCIQSNFVYLKQNLNALDLTDFLLQENVLTDDDIDSITSKPTRIEQTDALLRLILRSGPGDSYKIFLKSLKATKYPQVERLLVTAAGNNSAAPGRQASGQIQTDSPQSSQAQASSSNQSDSDGQHIFISYCHADKDIVHRIYESLRSKGYKVWIDVDHMGNNLLDGMAHAVERSRLVLMCISQKYKDSVNCKKEAEYTSQQRKNYIIVKVQQGYKPDGWLGLLQGERLYVDFSPRSSFDEAMKNLIKEIEKFK